MCDNLLYTAILVYGRVSNLLAVARIKRRIATIVFQQTRLFIKYTAGIERVDSIDNATDTSSSSFLLRLFLCICYASYTDWLFLVRSIAS